MATLRFDYNYVYIGSDRNKTYRNRIVSDDVDLSTLAFDTSSSYYTLSFVTVDGDKYVQFVTRNDTYGASDPYQETIAISAQDNQSNTVYASFTVNQDNAIGSFGIANPETNISWQGGTIRYNLTGEGFDHYSSYEARFVSGSGSSQTSETLNVSGPFEDNGSYYVNVTFTNNDTYSAKTGDLYIFLYPYTFGDPVYQNNVFSVTRAGVPVGSISWNDNSRIFNSMNETGSGGQNWAEKLYFTYSNIDRSTITVTQSGNVYFTSLSVPNNQYYVSATVVHNDDDERKSGTLTISATDYGGTVRSATLPVSQYKSSEGWGLWFDSPSTTSSNPYITNYNGSVTLTYYAKNISNVTTTTNSYITGMTTTSLGNDLYQAVITLTPNTGTTLITSNFRLNGDNDTTGGTITTKSWTGAYSYFYFRQKTQPGSISVSQNAITVPADNTYQHLDVYVTTNNINGTPTASVSGGVTGTFSWRTYDNKEYLLFTPDNNSGSTTLTGTITVSGTDYNGDTVSATYSVTQKPYNLSVVFDPYRDFILDDPLNILYNESSTTFQLTCKGIVSLDSIYVGSTTSTFSNYYTGGTITKLDDEHYTLVINTSNNNTHTPTQKAYLSVEPTTEFGKNPWIGGYNAGDYSHCSVRKCAIPGVITVSANSRTVDGESGTTTFSYTADQYMTQPISVTHSGDMDITNFTINGNNIVVEYGENRTAVNAVETIVVSGTDYQGLTITQTIVLTQEPLAYLEFVDTEKTIGPTESTVTFEINDLNVSNITVSYTNTFITNYTLTTRTGGHLLTITTANNSEYVVKQSTITITGTSVKNETLRDTVLLKKNGPDGSINLDPDTKTITKTASSFPIGLTLLGVNSSTLSYSTSGDVVITGWTLGGNQITFSYDTNNTNDTIYGTITVNGTDYKGLAVNDVLSITQLPYDSMIEITPSSRELDYGENTATYTVDILYADNIQISTSGDTSFITNTTLSNGTLTVTTADFSAMTVKTATITISGTGVMGTVSDSATLTKYGPDGTITPSPNTLILPKSPRSTQVTIAKAGIPGNLSVSSSGTVSFSSLTLNGSYLTVYTNENQTQGDLTGTITITGTDYKGNTITATIPVTQHPYDSYIRLTPATRTVDKEAGSVLYTIETDSVDTSTLSARYTGQSITSVVRAGNNLTVNYSASQIVANKTNTITVSGTDIYSNSVSGSAELIQTGIDPTITANTLNIGWDQGSATAFVTTNGVGNPSVSFSGNVTIDNYTITPTTGGYNIVIETPDNPTTTVYHSVATVTGTVTEGQYEGQTRTTTFNVNKYGKEGVVTIDPTAKTIRKAGESIAFDVTLINMDLSTVTASTGSFNNDKSVLTVSVGANSSNSDRTINVTVSGTDYNGATKSATAVITQYGVDPYIAITPAAKVISSTTSVATFVVSSYKVTGLEVSVNGTIDIIDYTLSGGVLTVTSRDNTDVLQKVSLITISGTDELGDPISGTATLTKYGTGGGILVNGDYVIPSNAGSLVIDYTAEDMDENSIVATATGDINITGLHINRADKKVVVSYGANSTSSSKTGSIILTGIGDDGLTKIVVIDLTQLGNSYSLSINPDEYSTTYAAGSKSFTVTSTGVSGLSLDYDGSMDVTSCTYSAGTINAVYGANNNPEVKYLYLTITGAASNGYNVSSSAVLRQNSSSSYTFALNPAGQTPKTIEASATRVNYTVDSYRSIEEIGYDITGFILSGRWGSKPSVVKDSLNFPAVKIPLNTHSAARSVKVLFTQNESGYTFTAVINQQAGVEPNVTPIWKDFVNSVSADTFIEYHINLDGDIIYAGKAYKYPDATKVTWSINDAVSNYLGNGISFTEGIQQIPDYSKDFYMETNTGQKYVETFYNSWAYKDADYVISDPIDNRVDPRQWLPVSFLTTEYDTITVGGRTYAALKENDGWTVMTRLLNYYIDCNAGINVNGADGSVYNYKIATGDYVLYYSNAYGGWDALLCTGTVKKTDNIEHLTYRRKSKNQSDFSKVNYQNTITPTWSLTTGLNINGKKMYHLLESTMVYLHNLESDEIIPVVITNSQCDYLTYSNNGKKPFFYTITVEESNQKLRK